jgi:enoyl-CoA hydratase/carnithine racemase
MDRTGHDTLELEISGGVGTIRLINRSRADAVAALGRTPADMHWELGQVLTRLRENGAVRVVVLTGAEDGVFMTPGRPERKHLPREGMRPPPPVQYPDTHWHALHGVRLTLQALVEMEKPVIARVNGDAVGFGQSVMFACDLIVARLDAAIYDHHMALEGLEPYGKPFSSVPGDGGASLVPLHLSPAKAMEYLLLAKPYSGAELAQAGVINYAVPMAELDAVVDDLVTRLLQRSAYALAMTKRLAKRPVVEQLNRTIDAANAYGWVNFLHWEALGRDNHSLEHPQ